MTDAEVEALYREAQIDADRVEVAADWDTLPPDECLDDET